MATIDPVVVKIQADVADLKAGLEKAEASLKGLDDSVKKADTGFANFTNRMKQLGATLGVTFAATQVVSFFKESVAAAQEAEAAQMRLATLLRNTNGATEAQIVALGNQAKALEKVGVVSADNITVAQSQLATFDLSAAAIGKLTPAILDYVTAEKGAAASSDDYKQMTNSLAQALQGNFTSLTKVGFVLDDATKKQIASGTEMERSEALVKVLSSTYEGFNEKLRETSEGLAQVAKNDLNNLKQQIGEGLQPVIDTFNAFLVDTLIPTLSKFTKFLTDNKDTIIAVTKVLAGGAAAFAIYKTAIAAASAVTKVYQVVMVLLRGQQLATIASTNTLAASMLRLNAIMRANPIGVFITVATLAVAAIVALWKNSEKFRTIVITAGKAALQAFASIVPMVAQAYEAIMKVVSGPLRLLLEALSHLPKVGKYAKAGLDIMNKGLDGISDLGVKAASKATELSKKLDGLAKSAKKAGEETEDAVSGKGGFGKGRKGDGGGLDEKTQKKVDALKKKITGYYSDWVKAQADANDKIQEAQDDYDARYLEAYETFANRKKDLQERYDEQMLEAQERFDETETDLKKRRDKAEKDAAEKHARAILEIRAEYRKRQEELEKTRNSKIFDLEKAAQQKREDIIAAGQEKLADIVQKGRDRLRDAWLKGTQFSLTDLFGNAKESGASLITTLKNQLTSVRNFQKAAGELAGQGYTQTFIEQIVAAGPKAGMEMINELKKLSPEQQTELHNMYMSLEDIQTMGMDSLANQMSTSSSFATAELVNMYEKTQQDITRALSEVDKNLKESIAEAKSDYEIALAEAAKLRDDKLAEADAALLKAIKDAKAEFDEALAEAEDALKKAQDKAKKALDKSLQDAQDALDKALLNAQEAFEKRIDAINKSMEKKLNDLIAKIREAQTAIAALGGTAPTVAMPTYTPASTIPTTPVIPTNQSSTTNNINLTAVTNADSKTIANDIVYAIKYGQVIEVTPGIEITGLAAAKSGSGSTRYFE